MGADFERGFSWWALTARQDVVAFLPDEHGRATVAVRTLLLAPGFADRKNVEATLALMNRESTGGAFRQTTDGTILHEASAFAAEDTVGWISRALATAAVALTGGLQVAQDYADELEATPIVLPHPKSGLRDVPDDMLNVPEQLLLPAGALTSAWESHEPFARAADLINSGIGFCMDASGHDGLIAEIGFGSSGSSFVIVHPTLVSPHAQAGLPPVVQDAEYGHGLMAWLVLPMHQRQGVAARLAARLNDAELSEWSHGARSGPMHFGAWTTWGEPDRQSPAYRMFIPNLLAPVVAADNVAVHMAARALSVSRSLLPHQEPLKHDGLEARLLERLRPDRERTLRRTDA